MSTGPFRCLQGRLDVYRAVRMSSGLDNLSNFRRAGIVGVRASSWASERRRGRQNVVVGVGASS